MSAFNLKTKSHWESRGALLLGNKDFTRPSLVLAPLRISQIMYVYFNNFILMEGYESHDLKVMTAIWPISLTLASLIEYIIFYQTTDLSIVVSAIYVRSIII